MKFLTLFFLISFSMLANAENYNLVSGEATYTVKHTLKRVEGTSKELKGKIQCKDGLCEFLIAVKLNSFLSSDSNRDLNMQSTLETAKYAVAIAKGAFSLTEWNKPKSTLSAEIDFHGVKKKYDLKITSGSAGKKTVDLNLDLEAHKIERPSLFTMAIENTVPVHFELNWKEEI